VWWVELARLADPGLVADQVCRAVGFVPSAETTPLEGLSGYLADKACLVVLDNCEHVLAAAAAVAGAVLSAAERVRVVATSRQPVLVEGEVTWRVPSLSLPADLEDDASVTDGDLGGLASSDAVTLSWSARPRPGRVSNSACPPRRPSCRSAAGSTACRWRSNWPPRGQRPSR
jgi:predicted ATPase